MSTGTGLNLSRFAVGTGTRVGFRRPFAGFGTAQQWLSRRRSAASALQFRQTFLPLLRFVVDHEEQDGHDGDREVESGHGGHDCDVLVGLQELDVASVGGDRAPALDVGPGDDPGRPEQGGDQPGDDDHADRLGRGPLGAIGQRPGHREVSVETDDQ